MDQNNNQMLVKTSYIKKVAHYSDYYFDLKKNN